MHLKPGDSPYYERTLKIKNAANPRAPGSVVLSKPSHLTEDYQLKIAYRKYVTTRQIPFNSPRINFLFLHGNGMNKGIWHYQIDKLFTMYEVSFPDMHIDTVIAADHVNMGDSAFVNRGKLGHVSDWNDFARDCIMIAKIHEKEAFLHPNAFNVVVAHSMGGFIAMQMTANEPNLFQSSILINPVCVTFPELRHHNLKVYQDWYHRDFVKFYFDNIPEGENWYHKIYEHYTNRSFYRKFHPVVLRNMLEDEIPEMYDRSKYYRTVELKHDGLEDYINYYNSEESITATKSCYEQIRVPTKILCGENDALATFIDSQKDHELNFADIHVLEGKYHNMHAESPDLIMSLVNDFVVTCYKDHPKVTDFEYYKKYGSDYKLILRKKKLHDLLGDDTKIPSKL